MVRPFGVSIDTMQQETHGPASPGGGPMIADFQSSFDQAKVILVFLSSHPLSCQSGWLVTPWHTAMEPWLRIIPDGSDWPVAFPSRTLISSYAQALSLIRIWGEILPWTLILYRVFTLVTDHYTVSIAARGAVSLDFINIQYCWFHLTSNTPSEAYAWFVQSVAVH